MAKAGQFELVTDPITGKSELTAPAEYMKERGDARLASAMAGTDAGFNAMAMCAPQGCSVEQLICVFLQTDYAGWKGSKQVERWGHGHS